MIPGKLYRVSKKKIEHNRSLLFHSCDSSNDIGKSIFAIPDKSVVMYIKLTKCNGHKVHKVLYKDTIGILSIGVEFEKIEG